MSLIKCNEEFHSFIQQNNNICQDMRQTLMMQRSDALFLLTLTNVYSFTPAALDFAIGQINEIVGYLVEAETKNRKSS